MAAKLPFLATLVSHLSTAMYGWGTRDTLGNVTSFVEMTVSQSYRDRFFASLTSKPVKTIVSLALTATLWIDGA